MAQRCVRLSIKKFHAFSRTPGKVSIYVHWPYCQKLCLYCDFNKYVRSEIDHNRMKACLSGELKTLLHLSEAKSVHSIYFGGGTPSLALPATLEAIISTVKAEIRLEESAEITMEVNPSSLESKKLSEFKSAGVNRVSVGLQALKDHDLRVLGREHTVNEGLRCVELAHKVFGPHVSVDFMFGRPDQTVSDWRDELLQIARLGCYHVSLYQLTMKKQTPMERLYRAGKLTLPPEDDLARMYEDATGILESSGLVRYEVSNFAAQGYESKHNLWYWLGGDYVGIGPGAHGRFSTSVRGSLRRQSRVQVLVPEHWMAMVEKYGHGTRFAEEQTHQQICEELILLGMRTKYGISKETFESTCGCTWESFVNHDVVASLIDAGLISCNEKLQVTSRGVLLLDSIVTNLCLALDDIMSRHSTTDGVSNGLP